MLDCDSEKPDLVFAGAHPMFFPWIPPLGLPDTILLRLRKSLLEEVHRQFKDVQFSEAQSHQQIQPMTMYNLISPTLLQSLFAAQDH